MYSAICIDRATLPGNSRRQQSRPKITVTLSLQSVKRSRHQIRPEISLSPFTLNLLLVKDLNYSITLEPYKDLNYIKFTIGQAVHAFAIQPIRRHDSERTTQLATPSQL